MTRILLILLSCCSLLLTACKKDLGKIYGKVEYGVVADKFGTVQMKPAAGATVRIYKGYSNSGKASSGLTPFATIKTDDKGMYSFNDLSQGNYYLTAFLEVQDVFTPDQPAEKVKLSNGAFNTIAVMLIEGQSIRKDITIQK